VAIIDTTVLPNNDFSAQQNKIETIKLNKYRYTELRGLGRPHRFSVP
jgi:hypothetical protein